MSELKEFVWRTAPVGCSVLLCTPRPRHADGCVGEVTLVSVWVKAVVSVVFEVAASPCPRGVPVATAVVVVGPFVMVGLSSAPTASPPSHPRRQIRGLRSCPLPRRDPGVPLHHREHLAVPGRDVVLRTRQRPPDRHLAPGCSTLEKTDQVGPAQGSPRQHLPMRRGSDSWAFFLSRCSLPSEEKRKREKTIVSEVQH